MQTHMGRFPFAALLGALALACLGAGCTPSGPKALLQGAELIRKGNYEAAIVRLKIAKDLLPNDARAWNYLGLAYHGAGQYGEAIIAYQRAQELDKNLAEARYNLGELFLEQGNPVSAAEELTVFTALRPKSVEGWVRLGDAHFQNQRADRAQTSYYTALNLKRETPEAFNGLGLILLQRKNPRDAYRYFVEANKYDPDYAPAILNMAVLAQTQLNSPPTALAKYREYLTKVPDAPNAADVQAAIRQLDAMLNPRSAPPTAPAPEEAAVMVVASNSASNLPVETDNRQSKPTNAVLMVKTNTLPLATAKTNSPAAPVSAGAKTNVTKDGELVRQASVTNKPPVQATGADRSRSTATAEKPAAPLTAAPSEKSTPSVETARATPPQEAKPERIPAADAEAPLEVVQIEETTIQPPSEITPAGEIESTSPGTAQVASARNPGGPPATAENSAATPEKRGFFKRINPVNLFRSDKSSPPPPKRSADIVTPLPPDAAAPATAPATPVAVPPPTTVASATRPEVTEIPGAPSAIRYQYGRIKKPVPGDRLAAERLFERGVGAQTRRDPSGAASFFSAAIEADPTYFPAHYNLGLAGYSSGQWFRALSAFETALVLDPGSVEARYNFALTLQKASFPADAAQELERLLAQKPDNTRAMLLLGNVYAQDLNNEAGARQMYQQLLKSEPQHPQATAIRYWLAQNP